MHVMADAGGGCCGIKIIRALPYSPKSAADYCPSIGHDCEQQTSVSRELTSYWNYSPSPEMTFASAGDYFDWLNEQIQQRRPAGLIQVVLSLVDQSAWQVFLKNRGFKPIYFNNSNSGDDLVLFTLVYGNDYCRDCCFATEDCTCDDDYQY